MKTLLTIVLIAAADTLLVLAALLLVAGYGWQAAALGVATLVGVAFAAWATRDKPGDPVDEHAEQVIRALSGQSAVLPELHLLNPRRPGRHADHHPSAEPG